jgi:predicted dienelactone hydrolase
MKQTLRAAALALVTWVAVTAGGKAAAADTYSGFRQQTFDTAPGEKIDVTMWYPTATPSTTVTMGPNAPDVAVDAPTATGPFPLIMLSHGTGGNNLNHHQLATALARGGFIVAALTHPGDNFRDRSLLGKPGFFTERPRQVSRLIDALLADAAWKPLIDSNRIGFLGHSAGGFTGAALIGATPSIASTMRHCAANYDQDPWFCRMSGSKEQAIENARNADNMPAVPGSTDPRIKAAVLITPIGQFFPEASLKAVKVPVRVYVAGRDDVLVPKFHAAYVAASIPGAETVNVEAGGHFMLVSRMTINVAVNGAAVSGDPAGFDRAPVIAEAARQLPLWFARALTK